MKSVKTFQTGNHAAFWAVIFIAASLLSSCKDDEKTIPATCDGIEFTYEGDEGPEHWVDLCTDNAACGDAAQSPINIAGATDDATLTAIAKTYAETKTEIEHNGHTIEFVLKNDSSTIVVNGATYRLDQFHFHVSSEHTVAGNSSPMEVHFVHKDDATGKLAVIGVLFEEGAENAFLAKFTADLPDVAEEVFESEEYYNPAELMPASDSYFTYAGSLTTPPCSETVTWIVMEEPVTASAAQLQQFEDILVKNNRPVQALNGRALKHSL